MERLGAPEYCRDRLQGDAHGIIVWLLGGQCAARCLRVEPQVLSGWICYAEPVAHEARPETTGRAKLCHLFQNVVMCGEKEREPLSELVHVQSFRHGSLHVRDRIGEGERHFLGCRRTGFTDVITAY